MVRTIVIAAFLLMPAYYGAAAEQTTADQYADLQKNFAEAYNRKDVDAMAAAFTDDAIRVTPSGMFVLVVFPFIVIVDACVSSTLKFEPAGFS